MIRRQNLRIVTQVFKEVPFCDRLGWVNHWTLPGAVMVVEMFNQGSTRACGIEGKRTISDMASSTLESANRKYCNRPSTHLWFRWFPS
jgi:hypothetical protein